MDRCTLYVDIDDTLYHALPLYSVVEMEMYGTDRIRRKYYEPDELVEMYGENYKEMFYRALSPERVKDRVMYPYVKRALGRLYLEGFDIHFLTHTHFPDDMYEPLCEWLNENLSNMPFELDAFEESTPKVEYMDKDPYAYGIIDDRFKTLKEVHNAGYKVYGKKQITNAHTRVPYVKWFEDWTDVPEMIMEDALTMTREMV